MIRSLRRRHQVMTWALAVAAPALFLAGLALRAPTPTVDALPGIDAQVAGGDDALKLGEFDAVDVFVSRDDLWNGARIRTGAARDDRGLLLALKPLDEVDRPDALLYYTSSPLHDVGAELPGDVVLLGPLSGSRTVVRKPTIEGERQIGSLILYNLAEHKVIGWAPLGALAGEGGS